MMKIYISDFCVSNKRKATIAHEVGHALKLQHPVETGVFDNVNHYYYPDEYKGWETFPSIMMPEENAIGFVSADTYIDSIHCFSSFSQTIYDTSVIKSRWESLIS